MLFEFYINGINDNKLISKSIRAPNHELDKMEMKVPLLKDARF